MLTRVLSIFDCNDMSGRGHSTRQQELAVSLRKHKIETKFLNSGEILPSEKFREYDLVIIDVPGFRQVDYCPALQSSKISLGFDWYENCLPDYNIVVYEQPERIYEAKLQKFVGLEYFVIRDDILKIARHSVNFETDYAFISLGHSATVDEYRVAIDYLKKLWDGKILVCLSQNRTGLSEIGTKVIVNPSNFAKLLFESKVVVTNGGTTMMESLALGKRTHSFPRSVEEYNFAHSVKQQHPELNLQIFGSSVKAKDHPSTLLKVDGVEQITRIILRII